MNGEFDKQWTEHLEGGSEDNELLSLAGRLKRAGRESRSAPSLAFRRQLRRDLLNRHATRSHRGASVWRWVGSLAAVGLLAVVVGLMWLSISSSGRPSFGGAIGAGTTTPGSDSGLVGPIYRFLDHSITGGVVTETMETNDPASQTVTNLLTPGIEIEIVTRWSLPTESGPVSAFIHLLDSSGQTVAQGDAPVQVTSDAAEQSWGATLTLSLPVELPPGDYQLVAGLYATETGARLPLDTGQGQTTTIPLGEFQVSDLAALEQTREFVVQTQEQAHDVLHFQIMEVQEDALAIHEVSPSAGTTVEGTSPVDFTVTIDYALASRPQAILEARIVDRNEANGRGVGLATVDVSRGSGTVTLTVVVNPATELAGPADLGLWLQLKPDSASAPILIEMPDSIGWRYAP